MTERLIAVHLDAEELTLLVEALGSKHRPDKTVDYATLSVKLTRAFLRVTSRKQSRQTRNTMVAVSG